MKTAILIPCYNEEKTVARVIKDFQQQLPDAQIYVYDNNSSDQTAKVAKEHGAIVRHVFVQGKANVVRAMFRQIEADIYVMVDGDNTYPASEVHKLINTLEDYNCDMVVGDRLSNGSYHKENSRRFHDFGNSLVRNLINFIFNADLKDIMTGYRAFSKQFVKNYPVMCNGFELETEMTIFALNNHMNIKEVPISFSERPEGSFSKLKTYTDGRKVIVAIFNLFRHYKPLQFFGVLSIFFFVASFAFGIPPITEYFQYHYVYKLPSAILASGLMLFGLLSFAIGLILDTISINDRKSYQIRFVNGNH